MQISWLSEFYYIDNSWYAMKTGGRGPELLYSIQYDDVDLFTWLEQLQKEVAGLIT